MVASQLFTPCDPTNALRRNVQMTSPPQRVTVSCPKCNRVFEDWYRPSINLSLGEPWTDEDIERATTVECPHCKHRFSPGSLIVDPEGTFNIHEPSDE